MFPVEGRMLAVFAALGVAFAMVILSRLSEVPDSTEPHSPATLTSATTTRSSAVHAGGEAALHLGDPGRRETAYALRDRPGARCQLRVGSGRTVLGLRGPCN